MTDQMAEKTHFTEILETGISFDDFMKRYEGQAVEWHGGKVVRKVSNNEKHQVILGFLYGILSYMLAIRPKGRVYLAGLPMFISAEQPAREPDLMIILEDKFENVQSNRLMGAADIVVEVVSPGSDTVDRGQKFNEYESAGVQEYWLIDPIRKVATIYVLDDEQHYQRYGTEATITSKLLADFSLDASILWQDDLPAGPDLVKIVEAMLKTV